MDSNIRVFISQKGHDKKINEAIINTFNDCGVSYELKKIKKSFPEKDLISIIKKSEYGFESVIASRAKIFENVDIDSMKFSELINFMINNTSTIKLPIIISDQRVQIGRNIEGIIDFLKEKGGGDDKYL